MIFPFHNRSQGRQPPAAVAPDDVAAVRVTAGWRESSRSSSWPVYPVAPGDRHSRGCLPRPRGLLPARMTDEMPYRKEY